MRLAFLGEISQKITEKELEEIAKKEQRSMNNLVLFILKKYVESQGEPKKMKAYKLRIYPNKEQREKLDYVLEICRQAYNILLGELQDPSCYR